MYVDLARTLSGLEQHVVEYWPSLSIMVIVFRKLLMVQLMYTQCSYSLESEFLPLATNYVSIFLTHSEVRIDVIYAISRALSSKSSA